MQDHTGELFTALQRLLPQHGLSRLAARLAKARTPWLKQWLINRFVSTYSVDISEALQEDLDRYESFNAFFTRQLKPDARLMDSSDETCIVSPADGTISQIGQLDGSQLVQAKGKTFTAEALLGSSDDAESFYAGHFTTIYLSPRDYHRVHMPIDGRLLHTRYIPGQLFSVNGATARHIPGLFARNERLVCLFDTPLGRVAVVLVGAMLVAGIGTVWHPAYQPDPGAIVETLFGGEDCPTLAKGDELGHFNFGSTVILLFEKDVLEWRQQFQAGSTTRVREQLATANHLG